MLISFATVTIWLYSIQLTNANVCSNSCPIEDDMTCGLDLKKRKYTMFPSKCALKAYSECHQVELSETPLKFCIQDLVKSARRMYGESCPAFCPSHYRPVCGASKLRSYIYRTFNNGCFLDMLNCRGDEDFTGFVEVPLENCQRHLMKNIFKEQVVITNMDNFHDVF